MSNLTHTQQVWAVALACFGVVWTAFWAWVWFMAFRVLRWTYLEKRYAWKTERDRAPEPPPATAWG